MQVVEDGMSLVACNECGKSDKFNVATCQVFFEKILRIPCFNECQEISGPRVRYTCESMPPLGIRSPFPSIAHKRAKNESNESAANTLTARDGLEMSTRKKRCQRDPNRKVCADIPSTNTYNLAFQKTDSIQKHNFNNYLLQTFKYWLEDTNKHIPERGDHRGPSQQGK